MNDFSNRWGELSDVDERYNPQLTDTCAAPYALIPRSALHFHYADSDQRLLSLVFQSRTAMFVWHPDALAPVGQEPRGTLTVAPLASTRTLWTRRLRPNVMVKTNLPKRHFGANRALTGREVAYSIALSHEIEQTLASSDLPFGFLPETIGLVYGDPEDGVGVIYREPRPRPHTPDRRLLVPYHALHSPDPLAPGDPLLLIQLVQQFGGSDPLGYFTERITGRLQAAWCAFVLSNGVLLEVHGEDAFLEMDTEIRPRRLIFQDFQSARTDALIRARKGLPDLPSLNNASGGSRGQELSLSYDYILGELLLRRLVNAFIAHYQMFTFTEVAKHIAQQFHSTVGSLANLLPATAYGYKYLRAGEQLTIAPTGEPFFR
jgi:hypothetical protein